MVNNNAVLTGNRTVPAINQIQVHYGMGADPTGLVTYGTSQGIITQAYSPLGNGKLLSPGDKTLESVAKAHGKSSASSNITCYTSTCCTTWIRDVFCYQYAQDKCPIMNQRQRQQVLVHDGALVLGV